jgi:fused signal recognition particle receptor
VAAALVDDPPPATAPVPTAVPAPAAAPVPATVPAPGIAPVKAVSAESCSEVPVSPVEAVLPSQAAPAPAGNPAKDPPPSLFVPVAPPPTIGPPGPAHWLTGALPDGFAPIPLRPGQNSIKY